MRAWHSRSGIGIFHGENSTGSSINSPFSLNTLYFIKRPKIHKDHACTGREKAKCVIPLMCTSKCQRVWERRKKTQGQKRGWTLPKQNGQIGGGAPCSQCHCSVFLPCLAQIEVRIKKFSALSVVGLQACSTWLTTMQSFSFFLCFLYPSLQGFSCSQSSRHNSLSTQTPPLKGSHWTVCWQLKKPAPQESSLLHHHHGRCPNPEQRKASGTAIITSFKTPHREKLRTLADLSIRIIAMVFF